MITATDKVGNVSNARNVTVRDVTPPPVPTVNKVTNKTVKVTGKAEKGATVYIFSGNTKIGQGVVNSKGNFSIKIKAQKKGTTLRIYAEDKAKNKSKNRTVKILMKNEARHLTYYYLLCMLYEFFCVNRLLTD